MASLDRRAGLSLFVLCLVAYGWFVYRGPIHNADSRLALTYSLVERGTPVIDTYAETTADRAWRDGHYYSDKAPGVSLLLAPLYAAIYQLPLPDRDQPSDRFLTRYLLTYLGIGVPSAAFAAWLFHWLRGDVRAVLPRALVVVGYALGSPAFPFSVVAFGHVPAGMCLFGAFALARRAPYSGPPARLLGAGALLGAAVLFEYPAAVPAGLIGAYALWPAPRPAAFGALAAGAALPLAVLATYHSVAFGAPWRTGYAYLDPASVYAGLQQTGVLGVGLPDAGVALALLAGPRRGLFVVSPWLLLALPGAALYWRAKAHRTAAVVAAAAGLALLAVNSGYVVWHGGASWGPRHLVPALPLLAYLALPAAVRWRAVTTLLVVVSVVLTVAAVASGALPPAGLPSTLRDYLLPSVLAGRVTNNWGQLFGLHGWTGVLPLAALAAVLLAWTLRRVPRRRTAGGARPA